MEKLERTIKEAAMDLLRTVPYSEVVKIKGGAAQESGLPDLLFTCRALGGRAVWIELKKPGEEPRKLQRYKLDRWRRAGAVAISISSIGELEAILGHLHALPVAKTKPVFHVDVVEFNHASRIRA